MIAAAAVQRLNAACVRTFGEPATLDSLAVSGIFQAVGVQAFETVADLAPTFQVRSEHAPLPQTVGALLQCAAGTFRVRRAEPDGLGMTTLTLEAA